jgi:opacity protein-like surface antigen
MHMMRLIPASVLGVLLATPALAADYGGQTYGEIPAVPYEFGSGWYLRGDIGYSLNATPDANFGAGDGISGETFSDTFIAGGGFGYQINNWFRTDVTLDYRWGGNLQGTCTVVTCTPGAAEFAKISGWSGLLNAYFDLGNWGGLTPYVGGGIGFSYLTASEVRNDVGGTTTQSWADNSTWNLAWSLTAGASYAITPNLLVDANYRYTNLGDAKSGAVSPASATPAVKYDHLSTQEIRVGLRYLIK